MEQKPTYPSRRHILEQAWPIILANSAVPLLGLADTFVIGNYGNVTQLGAIALGALIFNFLYWSFGFLRMSTTGFVAQAAGAGDETEMRATLARALLIAAVLGLLMIALQWPLKLVAVNAFQASSDVENIAADYFSIRIWGAPAILSLYAIMGALIGLGRSKDLLALQLLLNGLNIILDILFAAVLGWGAQGIALGTAIAEWTTLAVAVVLMLRLLRARQKEGSIFWSWSRIFEGKKLQRTLSVNSDILIRTLLLLFAFAWFINQSAIFGDAVLGANHILLQVVSFSAFFLDGFAFVAEAFVGAALGAKNAAHLKRAIKHSTELAAFTAIVLALIILAGGSVIVATLTDIVTVRAAAETALPWAALYVLCSFAAFQLDGVFIGATRTSQMRNAAIMSTAVFLFSCFALSAYGNHGLWAAFVIYVLARAGALLVYYPGLVNEINGEK